MQSTCNYCTKCAIRHRSYSPHNSSRIVEESIRGKHYSTVLNKHLAHTEHIDWEAVCTVAGKLTIMTGKI